MGKKPSRIVEVLEKDSEFVSLKLNRFYEVLRKLRYEGKQNLGRNLDEAGQMLKFFKEHLEEHMREEEKIIFPFLETHIPRLQPMVYLLLSEHEDFRNNLRSLGVFLAQLKKRKGDPAATLDKVSELGTYLICLLRSHMWVETRTLYRAADKELREPEKKKLVRRLEKKI